MRPLRLRRLGPAPPPAVAARSPAARWLSALAVFSMRRPRRVLIAATVLAAIGVGGAARHLELRTSNLDLIAPDLPEVGAYRALAREFGTPNTLIVVLEGDDPAALRAAADLLAPRLAESPGVRHVLAALPRPPLAPAPLVVEPRFTSRDGRMLFVFVQPADPESRADTIAPFVEGVRRVIDRAGLPAGVRAGLTGLPQYALDDRDVVRGDIGRLSALALILVAALFVAAFASLAGPLSAIAALLAAVAAVLGLAAVHPGHLTLVSAFFGSILFGLGIDYGILAVDRAEELESAGIDRQRALGTAIHALAPGLATGALTTASAFFALIPAGFRGFAELGLIAGGGVLLCLLAAVTVLPALLSLLPRRRRRRPPRRRLGRLLARLQHPALALAVAGAAIVAASIGGPGFDQDYLNLEPSGSEAVRLEREMVRRSDYASQYAAFITGSRAEAEALAERLAAEETVASVHWAAEWEALTRLGGGMAADGLRDRFVSPAGRYAVYAYPAADVWDPVERDRFLDRMTAIDPEVTGMPVLGRLMVERSRRALAVAGSLAAAALLVCLIADLRDLRLALLAALPTFLGLAALRGLMKLLGVAFNPLDVLALPVLIGIAVDDGVHVIHRLVAERGDVGRALTGTGRGVVLTSTTSIAAFGALAFARHQGLASFGLVLALGVAVALALSVLVLPQAAMWLAPRSLGLHGDRNREVSRCSKESASTSSW